MSIKETQNQKAKWWKSGYAWLVFCGPAMVVVASLITVYIAVEGQDPVLAHEENSELHTSKALTTDEKNSLAPAVLARNHAATGVNREK